MRSVTISFLMLVWIPALRFAPLSSLPLQAEVQAFLHHLGGFSQTRLSLGEGVRRFQDEGPQRLPSEDVSMSLTNSQSRSKDGRSGSELQASARDTRNALGRGHSRESYHLGALLNAAEKFSSVAYSHTYSILVSQGSPSFSDDLFRAEKPSRHEQDSVSLNTYPPLEAGSVRDDSRQTRTHKCSSSQASLQEQGDVGAADCRNVSLSKAAGVSAAEETSHAPVDINTDGKVRQRVKRSYPNFHYLQREPKAASRRVLTEVTASKHNSNRLKHKLQALYLAFLSGKTTAYHVSPNHINALLERTSEIDVHRNEGNTMGKNEKTRLDLLPTAISLRQFTPKIGSEFEPSRMLQNDLLGDDKIHPHRAQTPLERPNTKPGKETALRQFLDAGQNTIAQRTKVDQASQSAGDGALDSVYLYGSSWDADLAQLLPQDGAMTHVSRDDAPHLGPRYASGGTTQRGQGATFQVSRRRIGREKASRVATFVRDLFETPRVAPEASQKEREKERQEKEKKEPLQSLVKSLYEQAQPLKHHSSSSHDLCQDDASVMKCPSDASVCLIDVMFCDGIMDCPFGEDEETSFCLLRMWAFTWLSNIHSFFASHGASRSRDSRLQPRDFSSNLLQDRNRPS